MGPVAEAASVPWQPDMASGKGSLLPLGPMLGQRKELESAAGLSRHLPAEASLQAGAAGSSMPWQSISPPPASGSLLPGTWNVDGIFEAHWSHVQGRKAALTSAGSGTTGGLSLPRKHPLRQPVPQADTA